MMAKYETISITGTSESGAGNSLEVTYLGTIPETTGTGYRAIMYDSTASKFCILFDVGNSTEDIDASKAQELMNAIYGTRAQVFIATNRVKNNYIRSLLTADYDNRKLSGFIIATNGSTNQQNWTLTYFENDKEYPLTIDASREVVSILKNKMKVTAENVAEYTSIKAVTELITPVAPPEIGSKYYIRSTDTLLTVGPDDIYQYSELNFVGKTLIECENAPLDKAPADGVYCVSEQYYLVSGGKMENITTKTKVVTELPPTSGTIAVEGFCYIVGDKVYTVSAQASAINYARMTKKMRKAMVYASSPANTITESTLNTISNGTYPATLQANQYYMFTTTSVTDHAEIQLNTLYSSDGTNLTRIETAKTVTLSQKPVLEVAVDGMYYVQGTAIKQFTGGTYVDKGTVTTQDAVPDVTTPVMQNSQFYYVTSTKQLIYKIDDLSEKVTLTEGTDFEFSDNIPDFYNFDIQQPDSTTLYVLTKPFEDKPAMTAWMLNADQDDYEQVEY